MNQADLTAEVVVSVDTLFTSPLESGLDVIVHVSVCTSLDSAIVVEPTDGRVAVHP